MSFDFEAYFRQHDPTATWSIRPLTGGIVNLTVRAVRLPQDQSTRRGGQNERQVLRGASKFSDHESLVLKYAPPYVALVGEHAPFDRVRQGVEATALALFSSEGPLESLPVTSSVLVPRLIHHDEDSHILIIEDLGKLPPLSEYLSPSSPNANQSRYQMMLSDETFWRSSGRKPGHFFADLHSSSTIQAITQYVGADDLPNFKNPSMIDMVRDAAVSTIKGYLDRHGITDSLHLSRVVEQDYERGISDEERCFIVGDLWPGGILIGNPESCTSVPKLGVIDWEFSGPGRGINGDMAQLLAHLHPYLLAAKFCQPDSPTHRATLALIEGINGSYQALSSMNGGTIWIQGSSNTSNPPDPLSPVARIFRSAVILHGREIINNAIENDWSGLCGNGKEKDEMVRSLVQTGVQLLRLARSNAAEFAKEDNWKQLMSSTEARVIVGLFLGSDRLF
ncbi:hypothetical protein AJ79_00859 [Helicocarpus griseus UAMH5409]|uniref:Aminoglycoside phosphotransferase domain-containing protein n=1 Tax=Helicocarpus griseus UAMH5409 TaxID=1447875 RepID=A0A2B7Y9T5_9EURO|nr:hypothetical protein AJ79_00859 [Helicocarpus griseus UAMH5409]